MFRSQYFVTKVSTCIIRGFLYSVIRQKMLGQASPCLFCLYILNLGIVIKLILAS